MRGSLQRFWYASMPSGQEAFEHSPKIAVMQARNRVSGAKMPG
jgi:hypothetical protein